MRKKCPYSEYFWSLFSFIRTEYGDLHSRSPYSVRMRKNKDQQKTPNSDTFHAVKLLFSQRSAVKKLGFFKWGIQKVVSSKPSFLDTLSSGVVKTWNYIFLVLFGVWKNWLFHCFFILCQNVIFGTFFISAAFGYYLAKNILYLNCCI